jgi:hypothetical protein
MLHTGEKMFITEQKDNTLLGNRDLDERLILKCFLNK